MLVGIPNEIKTHEYRVSMVPVGVEDLTRAGHKVLVQAGAGFGSGISDDLYVANGAEIVGAAADIWKRADMIVKVKEPLPEEWQHMRPGQLIFTYFHFAADEKLTRAVLDSGATAVAYETIRDAKGSLPLLTPMSEVAGRMSIQEGAKFLERPRSAAARELEINVVGYALAVQTFTQTDDPRFRRDADVKAAEVDRHLAEYSRLARSDRERELAVRFDARWAELKKQGQVILDSKERPLNRADSDRLAVHRLGVEALLDDEIQPDATASQDASRDGIARDIRDIFGFALIVLVAGAAVAVLLGATVSRAVAKRERAIAEQGERFRLAADAVNGIIYEFDIPTGHVERQRGLYEVLGYRADEVPPTAAWWWEQIHPDDREVIEREFTEASGNSVVSEYRVRHRDGRWLHIEDRALLIRGDDGRPMKMVGCTVDVTAKKRADAELRRRETFISGILGSITDGFGVVCKDWRFTFANDELIRRFGKQRDEILGNAIWEMLPDAVGNHAYVQLHRAMAERVAVEYEVFYEPWQRWYLDKAFPTADGGLAVYSRDITDQKRAADESRQSEEFNRSLMEGSADCVKVLDAAGRLLHMNALGLCLMEIDDFGTLCGRDWPSLWPEDVRDEVRRAMASARDGETHSFQAFRPTVKGTPRWWDVTVSPVRNGRNGQITRLLAVSRDTTARKRASDELLQSEARFRAGIEAVSDIVWTNDARGMMAGEQVDWGNFTGQDRESYQGYGWSRAVHPDDAQPTIDAWNEAVAGKRPFDFEHRVRRSDGQWRLCSIRAVPILDDRGEISEWVGVHTDITDRKRAEDELRRLAADLSAADRRKDEFLATLAHELRNPLAPIRNGLEIMRRSASRAQGHPEEEVVAKARTMMERQLGQMVHLVDDLLDVSRIRQGKLVLRTERIDLASAVTGAVETARPSIEAGGHTLTVTLPETPVFVDGDATRLAQVFANLLNNAAKYSPPGGRIALTASADDGGIVVRVKDTGLGIPAEMLPKIFEMFTQVDASLDKSQGGLGIGLTLVKRLVEMHGGSVDASSAGPGHGSEFTVRLPVAASGELTPAVENCISQPTQPNASKRILIADDNEDSAASLAMLLEILGHEIRTAEDGQQAVNAASEFAPEVVFLDIGMPKLNGYEACRRIRELPKGAAPFVIALTGWGHDDDRRQSREAGFDHHLVKPVDPAELEKLLDGLGRRESQK